MATDPHTQTYITLHLYNTQVVTRSDGFVVQYGDPDPAGEVHGCVSVAFLCVLCISVLFRCVCLFEGRFCVSPSSYPHPPQTNHIPNQPHPIRYKPPGSSDVRIIPLEIFVTQDDSPMYGVTTEDDGRGYSATRLPFQAYGALGALGGV